MDDGHRLRVPARKSFDSCPTWTDYVAQHSDPPEAARARVHLRGRRLGRRAAGVGEARREAAALRHFRHPGAVQLKQYDPSGHSAGPALIFDLDPRTLRLDEYLARQAAPHRASAPFSHDAWRAFIPHLH